MKFDARGVKRIEGIVIEIVGMPTFKVLIKDIKISDSSRVAGLDKGERVKIWCACLLMKKNDFSEACEQMGELLLNKEVVINPDPFRPNKQGCVNAHVYIEDTHEYVNEILVKSKLATVDNYMKGSPYWKKLKEIEIKMRFQGDKDEKK